MFSLEKTSKTYGNVSTLQSSHLGLKIFFGSFKMENPCSALFPKLKMGVVVYMSTIFENSVAKLSTVEVKIHSLTLKCNNNSLKKFVAVLVKVSVSILLL